MARVVDGSNRWIDEIESRQAGR
jgi:hypothetical protein